MFTITEHRTIVTMLAAGRPVWYVAALTKLNAQDNSAVGAGYGYLDRTRLRHALTRPTVPRPPPDRLRIGTGAQELRSWTWKLEVVVVHVADVDRAKRFDESFGVRLDVDHVANEDLRWLSSHFPARNPRSSSAPGPPRITSAGPGSLQGLHWPLAACPSTGHISIGHGLSR